MKFHPETGSNTLMLAQPTHTVVSVELNAGAGKPTNILLHHLFGNNFRFRFRRERGWIRKVSFNYIAPAHNIGYRMTLNVWSKPALLSLIDQNNPMTGYLMM